MYNKWTNYSAGNYELCTDNFDELHIWGVCRAWLRASSHPSAYTSESHHLCMGNYSAMNYEN